MHIKLPIVCVVAVLCSPIRALAQPADPPADQATPPPADQATPPPADQATPPPADQATPPPASDSTPDARADEAWALYHRAYAAAAAGNLAASQRLLDTLKRDHLGHPAARAARAILQKFPLVVPRPPDSPSAPGDTNADVPRDDARSMDPAADTPTRAARAELALFQTLNGIALGIELCIAIECDSEGSVISLPLLGATVALGASLVINKSTTPGQRAAANSGASWGAFNAAMLGLAVDFADDQAYARTLFAGQAGGAITGHLLWRQFGASDGQVALANTVGTWAGALTALGIRASGDRLEETSSAAALLLVSDVGLLTGIYLARRFPDISRGRTLLIDAGGIIGALAGYGTIVLIQSDARDDESISGSMLLGASLGLAAATYASRRWDLRVSSRAQVTLMPNRDGGLSAGLLFNLD